MAVSLDDLVPRLAGRFPRVADPLLRDHLLVGANRFCWDTGIWRQELELDTPREGDTQVFLFPPVGARVASLIHVKRGDRPMTLAGDEVLDEARYSSSRATCAALIDLDDDSQAIAFDGPLTQAEPLSARGTLTPTLRARFLPDFLFYQWFEALVVSAGRMIFRDPSHDLYSERMAGMYEMQYQEWVGRARGRARSGATHAQRVVKYGGI